MTPIRYTLIAGYLILAAIPLVWLASTSIKTKEAAISPTARFIPSTQVDGAHRFVPTTESYAKLTTPHTGSRYSFFHYLANSIVIGLLSTVASVALGTSVSYTHLTLPPTPYV